MRPRRAAVPAAPRDARAIREMFDRRAAILFSSRHRLDDVRVHHRCQGYTAAKKTRSPRRFLAEKEHLALVVRGSGGWDCAHHHHRHRHNQNEGAELRNGRGFTLQLLQQPQPGSRRLATACGDTNNTSPCIRTRNSARRRWLNEELVLQAEKSENCRSAAWSSSGKRLRGHPRRRWRLFPGQGVRGVVAGPRQLHNPSLLCRGDPESESTYYVDCKEAKTRIMARRWMEGGLGWPGNISFGMRSGLDAASDMSGWTLPHLCVCVTLLVVVMKHCSEVCSDLHNM